MGSGKYRVLVDDTIPNTAVRLFLETSEPRVQFVKTGRESDELSLDQAVEVADWRYRFRIHRAWIYTYHPSRPGPHPIYHRALSDLGIWLLDLVIQVTAFTVAHSVTLALGLYGVLEFPSSIVEPLIAASIVYVAVENIWHNKVNRSRSGSVCIRVTSWDGVRRVLADLGLPERDFVVGLLSFNAGVELGQLAVILAAYISVGVWVLRYPWYQSRVAVPMSLLIGVVGCYWFIERVTG